MKTILLTLSFLLLTLGVVSIAPNSALACATCGCMGGHSHSHDAGKKKPCEMCAKKTMKKPEHYHGDKPCKVCSEHEKRWEMNKKMQKGETGFVYDPSNPPVGTLRMKSGMTDSARFN